MKEYYVHTTNCLGDHVEMKFPLYRDARKYFDNIITDKEMKWAAIYDPHDRTLVEWNIDE